MENIDIKKQIDILNQELKENGENYCKPRYEKIKVLQKEFYLNILKNKEYIDDLSDYNGKEINFIALNSKGEEAFLPRDEIVDVQNGRLYLSSFRGGIVYWSDDKKEYIHSYYGVEKPIDIVGFIDVEES